MNPTSSIRVYNSPNRSILYFYLNSNINQTALKIYKTNLIRLLQKNSKIKLIYTIF